VQPGEPDLRELHDAWLEWLRRQGIDPEIGARLGEAMLAAGLELVDHSARYEQFPLLQGRGFAWAARHRLVEAGLADERDLERWDAAFRRWLAAPRERVVFLPLFRAIGVLPGAPADMANNRSQKFTT
jgi:hypothetical protein